MTQMTYGITHSAIFLAQLSCAEAKDFIPTAVFAAIVIFIVFLLLKLKSWRLRHKQLSPRPVVQVSNMKDREVQYLQEPIVSILEMSPDIRESITASMRSSDNETLHRIFVYNRADYQPEALVIARNELARRGLSVLTTDEYWQQYTVNGIGPSGFCRKCWDQTTADAPKESDRMTGLFGFHLRLWGRADQCETCHSAMTRYWLWFSWWLPLVPVAAYRVIESTPDRQVLAARRIKAQ